ncbi:unnamed protein product, partial [Pleuronectes platessa]
MSDETPHLPPSLAQYIPEIRARCGRTMDYNCGLRIRGRNGGSTFSYDVELKLRKGNEEFKKTKKGINVTRDMRMDILGKIAQSVFEVKAYPDQDQIESVEAPAMDQDNHTDDSLEDERLDLVEELKKKNKNGSLINQLMELTFSLRRKEIVEMEPMVSEVQERWPALFCEAEATDPDEEQTKGLVAGVLTVLEEVDGDIVNVAVVKEEIIVLQDLPDLPTAFVYLFGLIYCLNLKYPSE